jgi:hypothetical protein
MGFDSFFFARIDYQDKVKRMANAGLEMLWNNRQDSNQDHSIFTHVNYNHYESRKHKFIYFIINFNIF